MGFQGPDTTINYLSTITDSQDAAFTVKQEGSELAVTYVDEYGDDYPFTFAQTTNTSAALAAEIVVGGYSGLCVSGPGKMEFFPAQLMVTTGTLDYTSGAVFLTLTGTIASVGKPPCNAAPEPANMWIVCGEGDGWTPVPPPDGGVPVSEIPAGTYTCDSLIGTYAVGDGLKWHVASGAPGGTLDVTQSGSTMTAAYTGDTSITGTLDFSLATPTAAYAGPGQTLTTPCLAPEPPTGPPPADIESPETLAVSAGSLVMDGPTLFVLVRGTMTSTPGQPSSCPGALKMGSLRCTKQ
jgi:hypothetical protein